MLLTGSIIRDTYQVEGLLSEGGMSQIYVVRHLRLPRRLALKRMAPNLGVPGARDRFRREAEILAHLRHPNIVDIADWDLLDDGSPFLVTELLQGEDLAALLLRSGRLPPQMVLQILTQAGTALQHAHQAGIVHRDLKPANLFCCAGHESPGLVKVLDFGIAKLRTAGGAKETATAALLGTPAYMSPEQALGQSRDADARADQFALGAIAYEMLAGRPAFARPGDAVFQILSRVIYEEPAFSELPGSRMAAVLQRALRKDREARFPTVAAFLAALGEAAAMPAMSAGRAPQRRAWRPARLSAVLALGLLSGGGSGPIPMPTPPMPEAVGDRTTPFPPPSVSSLPASPVQAGPPAMPPSMVQRLSYRITGTAPEQERRIRRCLKEHGHSVPAHGRIQLLRVSTLKVQATQPPDLEDALRQDGFAGCLRRAFASKEETPEQVLIQLLPTPSAPH